VRARVYVCVRVCARARMCACVLTIELLSSWQFLIRKFFPYL